MAFTNSALLRVAALPPNQPERIVLEFLLQQGTGRANAQPWSALEAHLARNGVLMSQRAFQQGILKATRENEIFIASNDHGASRGYFLIVDQQDAEIMRDWYVNRIATETARLNALRRNAQAENWNI